MIQLNIILLIFDGITIIESMVNAGGTYLYRVMTKQGELKNNETPNQRIMTRIMTSIKRSHR